MGVSEKTALAVLRGLERDGLAVVDPAAKTWRLSDEAERQYGRAVRLMDEGMREFEEVAQASAPRSDRHVHSRVFADGKRSASCR